MGNYLRKYGTKETPQSQPIPGSDQVPNSAGGYSFQLDDWKRLDRFLILGAEGGTYYIKEQDLVKENAESVSRCIKADGLRTVKRIVEISEAGRAPKNDPALFALAMCASLGDEKTRKEAFTSLPKVARIGTHLFHFASYVEQFRGWGRGLRTAVGNWYLSKKADSLAFQVVKYQEREGWGHSDLLRLAHPEFPDIERQAVARWSLEGLDGLKERQVRNKEGKVTRTYPEVSTESLPKIIWGFEKARNCKTVKEVLPLITEYGLTREMLPSEFLPDKKVQEALLPNLGYSALIRNLGNMTKSGFLTKGNFASVGEVVKRISDPEEIKRSKIHPIGILTALLTYNQGHGTRARQWGDSPSWEVIPDIVDALDGAFYTAFGNVTSTGKRINLALDVSGSMACGEVAGVPGLTPRLASAAIAMITYKVEPKVALTSFQSDSGYRQTYLTHHTDDGMVPLSIGRKSRLSEVEKVISDLPFGGTDCALPMLWALKNEVAIDTFIIYTDSETWAGNIHPTQALEKYRRTTGIPAKLVVVGMTSNGFSIADPNDAGMLDVVGFDTSVPEIVSQFMLD